MLAEHFGVDLKGRKIQDFTVAEIAKLPATLRPHVKALHDHYVEVVGWKNSPSPVRSPMR